MPAPKSEKRFLLCLHDVHVHNIAACAEIISGLKEIAGGPFSLAVIPFTGNASEEKTAAFRAQLAAWKSEGFELLAHGYRHHSDLTLPRSYTGFTALHFTQGEGEFAGLAEKESALLLDKSLAAWAALELPTPVGFIPPAWYYGESLPLLVLNRLQVFEGRAALRIKFSDGEQKKITSAPLSFAGIPEWSLPAAFAFARTSLRAPWGVPRLALHPVDFETNGDRVKEILRFALARRKRIFYRDLLCDKVAESLVK